ncbi:MAG: hypothetical protein HKP57_03635 [Halobacteria archaeon]|nr:hypothetical protein [Halobacteria archaeon]
MSIIQDLYNIYDKELSRYRAKKSSQNRLLIEMRQNLAFLREGLREGLSHAAIIAALENVEYRAAHKAGTNLASLQKKNLSRATYGGIREFDRYLGWDSERLIDNVYERIATLKKLAAGSKTVDLHARLTTLFKFLMVVLAHLEARNLVVRQRP